MKLSHPLTKAFRTTEGVLVIVMDVASAVTTILDPSVLPHKWAAAAIVAQHVALLAQRGYIKGKAVANLVGLPAPAAVLSNAHKISLTGDVAAGVAAVEKIAQQFAAPESAAKPDPEPTPASAVAVAPAPASEPVATPEPAATPTPVASGQPTTPAA